MPFTDRVLHLDIVSAEAAIDPGPVRYVIVPAELGELGILPQHAPLLTRIKPGPVRIGKETDEEDILFVSGGIVEVQPHIVTILSDTAVRGVELDEASALESKRQAEALIRQWQASYDFAEAQLLIAVAKLRVIELLRNRGA